MPLLIVDFEFKADKDRATFRRFDLEFKSRGPPCNACIIGRVSSCTCEKESFLLGGDLDELGR